MKKLFSKVMSVAVCTGILVAFMPQQAEAIPPIRVVVYGDSLMAGFQLQPEQAFATKLRRKLLEYGFTNVEVTDMSVPGETTGGGVERLPTLLARQPDVVVLELGANDALRGINTSVIHSNLGQIISALVQKRAYVVFIGMKAPSNMGYSYSAQMESSYRSLADAYKLAFYPFALEGVVGHPELNLADGYHPNARGVDVMVERIYPLVDTGVRNRWSELAYQQQMESDLQNQMQSPGGLSMPGGGTQVMSPVMPPIPDALGNR